MHRSASGAAKKPAATWQTDSGRAGLVSADISRLARAQKFLANLHGVGMCPTDAILIVEELEARWALV